MSRLRLPKVTVVGAEHVGLQADAVALEASQVCVIPFHALEALARLDPCKARLIVEGLLPNSAAIDRTGGRRSVGA